MSTTSEQMNSKESSGMVFDNQKKIVLASLPRGNKGMIERKVSAVKEVVPSRNKHEIGLVLQFYEYDVNETISAFLEDGAASVLNEWNCSSNKPNKKNKKKTDEKKDSVVEEKSCGDDDDLLVSLKTKFRDDKVPQNDKVVKLDKVSSDVERKRTSTISSHLSDNLSVDSKNSFSSRHNSVTNAKQHVKKKSLEKPIKELGRHFVSLQRTKNLLSEEMDRSEKRLKQSFRDLHKVIDEREAELTKELNEVKEEMNRLLAARCSRAEGLKMGTNRADVMNDDELNELRIDIKHFVSERKFDDDLGKTARFVRDQDRMIKEIKSYGEVVPVKNSYTGRRQSVSSTVSSLSHSEPSVASPTSAAVTVVSSATARSEPNVTSSCSFEMSTAEKSELHQRLQDSLRLQGLSSDTMTTRMNRPNYKQQRRAVDGQSPRRYNSGAQNAQNSNSGSQQHSKDARARFRTDEGTVNKTDSQSGRRSFGPSRNQSYRTTSRNVGHGQAPSAGGQP